MGPGQSILYVCGKHFITGYHVNDGEHPDYVPSIFPQRPSSEGSKRLKRYQRRYAVSQHEVLPAKRQRIKPPTEASPSETPEYFNTAYPEAPFTEDSLPQPSDDYELSDTPALHRQQVSIAIEVANLRRERDEARRERDEARRERDEARRERDEARRELQNWSKERLSVHAIKGNDSACRAMTGLSWSVFDCLHRYLVQFIKSSPKGFRLSTQDQLFLCLLKLRQNPSIALLSQILHKPEPTVRHIFQR
ncbi:uncharacterized protein LOC117542470 [Gymnodraco acuticeps]|uniref:Uncharacterized protein LOC117542470 n=1 Tax=Gymnodraco acuticeps TaxID=8218 RepID=A0A6P8TPD8_GYMAC|nr:uncharacterized protein LOC117542470 [Gymnodraco acuticeps]